MFRLETNMPMNLYLKDEEIEYIVIWSFRSC